MRSFLNVLTILTIPLVILNSVGWVVFGIWLAVLGEWGAIIRGVLIAVGATIVITLLLIPHLAIGAAAGAAMNRGSKFLGWLCAAVASAYLYFVIGLWCLFVFGSYLRQVHQPVSLVPTLFWSYGVAIGPWAYMASKENASNGGSEGMTLLFVQVTYLLMVCIVAIGGPVPHVVAAALGCLVIGMLISFLVNLIVVTTAVQQASRMATGSE